MHRQHVWAVDTLEARRLLSAAVVDHILQVKGSNRADQIIVDQTADAYTVSFNGKRSTITDLPLLGINVNGGAGNDYVVVHTNLPCTINGGAGDDSLTGGFKDDRITGGPGNDLLVGNNGDDVLQGEAGNDVLYGGNGADYLSGGKGDDLLDSGAGIDQVKGGPGNDDGLNKGERISDEDAADKGKNHTQRKTISPGSSVHTSGGMMQLTNPSAWVSQPGAVLLGGNTNLTSGTLTLGSGNINHIVSSPNSTVLLNNPGLLTYGQSTQFMGGIVVNNLNPNPTGVLTTPPADAAAGDGVEVDPGSLA